MKKYNVIYLRDLRIFEKKRLRIDKVEKVIEASNFENAVKMAKNDKQKGFYLYGIANLSKSIIVILLLLLSGCYSVKQWKQHRINPCNKYYDNRVKETNPARFF